MTQSFDSVEELKREVARLRISVAESQEKLFQVAEYLNEANMHSKRSAQVYAAEVLLAQERLNEMHNEVEKTKVDIATLRQSLELAQAQNEAQHAETQRFKELWAAHRSFFDIILG